MGKRLVAVKVDGAPEVVASHAALRLAHLGEDVEPISATEFVWRLAKAERFFFNAPERVIVRALAEPDGTSTMVFDCQGLHTRRWTLVGLLNGLAISFVAAIFAPATGLLRLMMVLWPPLLGLFTPAVLNSGWESRLTDAASSSPTQPLQIVPETARWLTLSAPERRRVLGAVREVPDELAPTLDFGMRTMGQDRLSLRVTEQGLLNMRTTVPGLLSVRTTVPGLLSVRSSLATLWGWPLWQVVNGRDPILGKHRQARGWYAVGQFALGVVAIGQSARGWVAIGQMACGVIAVGQAAIGLLLALGQAAIGGIVGIGQVGLGLIAAGMVGFGLWLNALGPSAADLPAWAIGALALGITVLAVLGAALVRFGLGRVEQHEVAERLEIAGAGTAVASDASLSQSRMGGEDEARGLSVVDAE